MPAFDFQSYITDIPDYPKPGVIFKDVTTLFKDPEGFTAAIDAIAELEYGSDSLEMHLDAIDENDIVLVVDDLIATGGTAAAQARLVSKAGAKVEGFAFLLELAFLNPREALAQSSTAEVYSLISVD